MPNPYRYPEQFIHSQRDPRWRNTRLGRSDVTIGSDGCVVTATAYLCSRLRGHDITPADWNRWLTLTNGLTSDGRFRWDWFRMWSTDMHPNGGIVYQGRNPIGARYSCQWVQLGQLRHFVVLLRNPANGQVDICLDPWTGTVESIYKFPRRFEKVYFRTNVQPAT